MFKSININEVSNIFYHYSDFLFEKADINLIEKNRKNHINGLLGLYFTTIKGNWAKSFGKFSYEINIPEKFNYEIIEFNKFVKLTSTNLINLTQEQEIEYFKNLRKNYLDKNIDYLLVLENDNTCGMGILINLDLKLKLLEE